MPRIVLLIFAVVYLVLWVWHPLAEGETPPFSVFFPAMYYLFPALLYCLASFVFLVGRPANGEPPHETRQALRDTFPLLTLALVLYLPLLVIDGIEDGKAGVGLALSLLLGVCFILLSLAFAYEQTSSLEEWSASDKTLRLEKLWQPARGWFRRVASWMLPGLLLSAGAILVLASLFLPTTDGSNGLGGLRGGNAWITSISEVTDGIKPIQSTKAILGRVTYVLALGAAAATLTLVCSRKFRLQISKPSRLWLGLTGLTSFLAVYTAADLNFGWLGLFAESRRDVHWVQFCLWLILWLVPLALWAWPSRRGDSATVGLQGSGLNWLILLFLPVVLLDVVMAPALVGNFLNLTGLAIYVAGLQFLCWGFVRSITLNRTG
ncbi:MAG TPA: hypothetical protein VEW05_13530 [Candidatus Polarisedimenticolia bacterium]|nr:hypothetical protein [Candidatus Polarisedimenticolia bacterium]